MSRESSEFLHYLFFWEYGTETASAWYYCVSSFWLAFLVVIPDMPPMCVYVFRMVWVSTRTSYYQRWDGREILVVPSRRRAVRLRAPSSPRAAPRRALRTAFPSWRTGGSHLWRTARAFGASQPSLHHPPQDLHQLRRILEHVVVHALLRVVHVTDRLLRELAAALAVVQAVVEEGTVFRLHAETDRMGS